MTVDANPSSRLAVAPQRRGVTPAAGLRAATARLLALSRRHIRLALVVLALLAAGLIYLVVSVGEEGGSSYVTATVQRGNIEDTVTALGNLQPHEYVDVGAQASGQLMKLDVDLGDRVKQGQLIAEIDPRVLTAKVETDKSNLANLKAQLSDKQAQLALARANYARQQRLMKADATSQSSYDAALQALRSGTADTKAVEAQIAAAQSQLDGDQITLGYTKIYAPMDGTVVSITAKQGQMLNANQQAPLILRIADLSTMEVDTQVSEADVPKLRIGMPAYFTTLGEPNKRWTGTLTQIQPTPEVVNNVVLYTATFDVKNPDRQLMTQMTAQVFFVTAAARDTLIVPVAALHPITRPQAAEGGTKSAKSAEGATARRRSDRRHRPNAERRAKLPEGAKPYWVQVMGPDGNPHRRRVGVGVSNRVSAQILSGLKAGDQVVVGSRNTTNGNGAGEADRDRARRFRGFRGFH